MADRLVGHAVVEQLIALGQLGVDELATLERERQALSRLRFGLHLVAGKAEERLRFDHQKALAARLDHVGEADNALVEQMMQGFYRSAAVVLRINDRLLQRFEEHIEGEGELVVLDAAFVSRRGYLAARDEVWPRADIGAVFDLFAAWAAQPDLRGLHSQTARALAESLHALPSWRDATAAERLRFLELLRGPVPVRTLERMARLGVLGTWIPEFARVTGRMQFDLFHVYTVDQHTLAVLRNIASFADEAEDARFSGAHGVWPALRKPELLLLAGLFHDIAKGRGGDHSELGAVDAEQFCRRHKLPAWDTRLVVWLVENHLVMSTTAQRKDLSDPQVINDFAQRVGDETHLDYLYVLTVADINATNPTLWNSWRASLLRQLYTETKRALKRGLENPLGREEQIRQTQRAALDDLVRHGTDPDDAEQLWAQLGDDYFLRHTATDVAWHTDAIIEHPANGGPLVLIKETTQREFEGGTQIFIYAPDQHDFFAVTVAAMDQLNLNIHDARILTSSSQFTLDTYIVLEADGSPIGNNPERIEEIRSGLIAALRNPDDYLTIIQRRVPRQLKHFAFPPQVTIHNDTQRPQTILEIIAPDRPGLLARVGQLFLDFDLSVQNAKIATLGERVEDVFFVTDADNQPLSDPQLCLRLQQAIIKELQQENEQQPSPSSIVI